MKDSSETPTPVPPQDTAPDIPPPMEEEAYDPYTGLFSQNPYDLNTGEYLPVRPDKPPTAPADPRQEKNIRILPPIIVSATIASLYGIYIFLITKHIFYLTLERMNTTIFILVTFFSFAGAVVLSVLTVRLHQTIGMNSQKRLDPAIIPVYFPFAICCLISLFLPGGSIPVKILCVLLMTASGYFLLKAHKKLHYLSRAIFLPLMTFMLLFTIVMNCYTKLLMADLPLETEYIIFTSRPADQLPETDGKHRYISYPCNYSNFVYSAEYCPDHQYYTDLIQSSYRHYSNRLISLASSGNDANAVSDLENLLLEALMSSEYVYDEAFFRTHNLVLRPEIFYAPVNGIQISDARICVNRISYTIETTYSRQPTDQITDVCYELLILPKEVKGNLLVIDEINRISQIIP